MRPDAFAVRGTDLALRWADREVVINGNMLRANCRCAGCRHLEITGNKIAHDEVALLAVTPMGYGLQLHFNDGHNRGIYPWQYLESFG